MDESTAVVVPIVKDIIDFGCNQAEITGTLQMFNLFVRMPIESLQFPLTHK